MQPHEEISGQQVRGGQRETVAFDHDVRTLVAGQDVSHPVQDGELLALDVDLHDVDAPDCRALEDVGDREGFDLDRARVVGDLAERSVLVEVEPAARGGDRDRYDGHIEPVRVGAHLEATRVAR